MKYLLLGIYIYGVIVELLDTYKYWKKVNKLYTFKELIELIIWAILWPCIWIHNFIRYFMIPSGRYKK